MTINEVEVRQANNDEITVGTVSEYEIKIRECTRECVIDGENTKVNSAWIGGTFNVEVNGSTIKHDFRYLDTIRHKKNGDENGVFKGILTSLGYSVEFDESTRKLKYTKNGNGLIPKIHGKVIWLDANGNKLNEEEFTNSGNPTRVKITSKLSLQEGLNKDKSDLTFYNELPISYISTSNVPSEDSAKFTIEGVVKDISDEYNSMGSTTGRYTVDLVVPNFFGVDVFNFIMEDKWINVIDGEEIEVTKDMFYIPNSADSFCQLGDTVKLSGDIESHTFGSVQTTTSAKRSFGGGSQSIRSGYDKIEWTIKSGDIVEGEDKYDTEIIAEALNLRDIQLDNNYKARLESYNESQKSESTKNSASPKNATSSSNANPFAKASSTAKKNPFAK